MNEGERCSPICVEVSKSFHFMCLCSGISAYLADRRTLALICGAMPQIKSLYQMVSCGRFDSITYIQKSLNYMAILAMPCRFLTGTFGNIRLQYSQKKKKNYTTTSE